jgi:hypothetical protein
MFIPFKQTATESLNIEHNLYISWVTVSFLDSLLQSAKQFETTPNRSNETSDYRLGRCRLRTWQVEDVINTNYSLL